MTDRVIDLADLVATEFKAPIDLFPSVSAKLGKVCFWGQCHDTEAVDAFVTELMRESAIAKTQRHDGGS